MSFNGIDASCVCDSSDEVEGILSFNGIDTSWDNEFATRTTALRDFIIFWYIVSSGCDDLVARATALLALAAGDSDDVLIAFGRVAWATAFLALTAGDSDALTFGWMVGCAAGETTLALVLLFGWMIVVEISLRFFGLVTAGDVGFFFIICSMTEYLFI